VKRILPASGGCSIVACWKGGRRDDAAGTKQASTTEVGEVDFRAGAERAERGGVLPGARVARVTFLLVEEAAAGGGVRGAAHADDEIVEVKLAGAEPECPATGAPPGGTGEWKFCSRMGGACG